MTSRLVFALALFVLLAGPAMAQPQPCGERSDFVAQIRDGHLQKPGAIGTTAHGATVELIRADNGQWALILNYPNGRSCQLAAGDGLGPLQAQLAGQTF